MSHLYTPYYCEENIWHLCQESRFEKRACYAVVVSNSWATCALFNQRAATAPGSPVVWDYHVVLFAETHDGWEVWDLDSVLERPTPMRCWFEGTFVGVGALRPRFSAQFRVIKASDYVDHLSTDRSHMLQDDVYSQPPPSWPHIVQGPMNLMRFVDMTQPFIGEVLTDSSLLTRFG